MSPLKDDTGTGVLWFSEVVGLVGKTIRQGSMSTQETEKGLHGYSCYRKVVCCQTTCQTRKVKEQPIATSEGEPHSAS